MLLISMDFLIESYISEAPQDSLYYVKGKKLLKIASIYFSHLQSHLQVFIFFFLLSLLPVLFYIFIGLGMVWIVTCSVWSL